MKVVTNEQMRALDRRAIDELGIPGLVLMENAAIGAVDALTEHFAEATNVAVVCGPGNNGGDGLAMARHLDGRGYRCQVFLVLGSGEPTGDAAVQWAILQRAGMRVDVIRDAMDWSAVAAACCESDVVIDAMFGTGLNRPLTGHFAAVATVISTCGAPCLAVDVPSGLDGDRATPIGPHVTAELTVTFALPKLAHVLAPACDAVGTLVVADLGLPSRLLDETPAALTVLEHASMAARLPSRHDGGHKGDFGHVVLVGGSPGKSGAVVLGARAAVRSGAGLVTAAVPAPLRDVVEGGSYASMTLALDADEAGALVDATPAQVLASGARGAVLAVGPGLGTEPSTVAAVRALARTVDGPLVLDADGLNAYADELDALEADRAGRPTVMTPHPGEMARLLGVSIEAVEEDRLRAARSAAETSGAVVVLKGRRTVIATPDGTLAINPTGNAGMATGGSGDVLTGLVAALLAQGVAPDDAARLGAFVHGLAGDGAARRLGARSLGAEDIVEALPAAFREVAVAGGDHD